MINRNLGERVRAQRSERFKSDEQSYQELARAQ